MKIKCTSCGMIYDISDDGGFITNCYLGCGAGDIVFDIVDIVDKERN